MTPEEVAKKYLLEEFGIDSFEFLDVVEWMDEANLDPQKDEEVWMALETEVDRMLSLYGDYDGE